MNITRTSPLSGKINTLDLDITEEQIIRWRYKGEMIQNVFPNLSADEREFIQTGYAVEDWNTMFPKEVEEELREINNEATEKAWESLIEESRALLMIKHKKQKRGYCCVGLDQPKCAANIGSVLRAAGCYGVDLVAVSGKRYSKSKVDTQKAWKHIPLIETGDLKTIIPNGCVPVAVDLVEGATNLCNFSHPERAFYIFGAEDKTLGEEVLKWCHHKVYISTSHCMNLAATANVVLYDRMLKRKEF